MQDGSYWEPRILLDDKVLQNASPDLLDIVLIRVCFEAWADTLVEKASEASKALSAAKTEIDELRVELARSIDKSSADGSVRLHQKHEMQEQAHMVESLEDEIWKLRAQLDQTLEASTCTVARADAEVNALRRELDEKHARAELHQQLEEQSARARAEAYEHEVNALRRERDETHARAELHQQLDEERARARAEAYEHEVKDSRRELAATRKIAHEEAEDHEKALRKSLAGERAKSEALSKQNEELMEAAEERLNRAIEELMEAAEERLKSQQRISSAETSELSDQIGQLHLELTASREMAFAEEARACEVVQEEACREEASREKVRRYQEEELAEASDLRAEAHAYQNVMEREKEVQMELKEIADSTLEVHSASEQVSDELAKTAVSLQKEQIEYIEAREQATEARAELELHRGETQVEIARLTRLLQLEQESHAQERSGASEARSEQIIFQTEVEKLAGQLHAEQEICQCERIIFQTEVEEFAGQLQAEQEICQRERHEAVEAEVAESRAELASRRAGLAEDQKVHEELRAELAATTRVLAEEFAHANIGSPARPEAAVLSPLSEGIAGVPEVAPADAQTHTETRVAETLPIPASPQWGTKNIGDGQGSVMSADWPDATNSSLDDSCGRRGSPHRPLFGRSPLHDCAGRVGTLDRGQQAREPRSAREAKGYPLPWPPVAPQCSETASAPRTFAMSTAGSLGEMEEPRSPLYSARVADALAVSRPPGTLQGPTPGSVSDSPPRMAEVDELCHEVVARALSGAVMHALERKAPA